MMRQLFTRTTALRSVEAGRSAFDCRKTRATDRRAVVRSLAVLSLALSLLTLYGCSQGLGGGGAQNPQVTMLLSKEVQASADSGGAEAAVASGFGNFKGRVVVEGALPTFPTYKPGGDAVCGAYDHPDESVEGTDGGLANVFVYLKKKPKVAIPKVEPTPVVIDQVKCRFVPHTVIFQIGQPLILKNNDEVAHNAKGSPQVNDAFNMPIGSKDRDGKPVEYKKGEPEPVRMECSIHGKMSSYHLPLDHPWGAVTDASGRFEIKGVPAGEMEFVAWHEKLKRFATLKIKVEVDKTTEKEIQVAADKLK